MKIAYLGLGSNLGDRDANLATRRGSGTEDLDERGPACGAEQQPERQEGELSRGHAPQSSSAGSQTGSRRDGLSGQRSCEPDAGQLSRIHA